jgi:signal transduction histidine kinase
VHLPSAVRESRAVAIFLAISLALTAVYFALPLGAAKNELYDAIGIGSALAIVLGIRLNRPSYRLPWLLFAAGNLSFAVADVIFNQLVNPPVPSVADWFYLAGYPLLAAGLVLLLISAGGRHRIPAIGEAAIVTFAFALFQWVWIVHGILGASGSVGLRAIDAAYPSMDVLLLAGLAGFFVTAAWRTPAFLLLVASVVAVLVSDEVYGVGSASYQTGDWEDLGWLLSYVLWAAAALHPSMVQLSRSRRLRSSLQVNSARVALLTVALLSAPFVLLVQYLRDAPLEVPAVVIAASGISILVILRLNGILRTLERLRSTERTARADAEQAQMMLALQHDQLVEADKLKDEFVALISHDLRTPLTSIIGYVELALEDGEPPLDEERRGYLHVVSRSSDRLLRLVDDLLFVARLQAGRLVLERSELDLCMIAEQATEEARPRAEGKQIALEFSGGFAVEIDGDKGRLFQLLDNLISNAIKFTPAGGQVDVRVATEGTSAVLEVIDSGIGLGPGEAKLVFDRFFRSSRVVAQQIPGTGLGLFIARAIVEAHGGTISVSSRDGGGAIFRVELPTRVGRTPADQELVA